ncbi:hypothetical protein QQ045_014848 [Rhodiola kirilowii]
MDQDQNFDAVDRDTETVDSNSSVSDTPGGTRYWTPQCLDNQRPFLANPKAEDETINNGAASQLRKLLNRGGSQYRITS